MKASSWRVVLAGVLALVGLAVGWRILAANPLPAVAAAPVSGTSETPRREFQGNTGVQATTIDSPSPTCYRPEPGSGRCYLQWSSISVAGSSTAYVISMTVTIDGQVRAYHSGFFQTSMYVPGQMYGPGFRVSCGFPAGDGSTGLGDTHTYVIRTRQTDGSVGTNSGSVQCPADVVQAYLPLVQKR